VAHRAPAPERNRHAAPGMADTPRPDSKSGNEHPSRSDHPSRAEPSSRSKSGLPTRESLRRPPSVSSPTPPPTTVQEPEEARRSSSYADEFDEPRSWDERLGPVGIALAAILACVAAWAVAWLLF